MVGRPFVCICYLADFIVVPATLCYFYYWITLPDYAHLNRFIVIEEPSVRNTFSSHNYKCFAFVLIEVGWGVGMELGP